MCNQHTCTGIQIGTAVKATKRQPTAPIDPGFWHCIGNETASYGTRLGATVNIPLDPVPPPTHYVGDDMRRLPPSNRPGQFRHTRAAGSLTPARHESMAKHRALWACQTLVPHFWGSRVLVCANFNLPSAKERRVLLSHEKSVTAGDTTSLAQCSAAVLSSVDQRYRHQNHIAAAAAHNLCTMHPRSLLFVPQVRSALTASSAGSDGLQLSCPSAGHRPLVAAAADTY